jgi:hypothetical protein
MATSRRGRPNKPATPGKLSALGLRVTAEVKDLLDVAAKQSGRTQSGEAERRIEATFRSEQQLSQGLDLVYGEQIAGLLTVIGRVLRDVGPAAHAASTRALEVAPDWLSNPFAFDQAVKAIGAVMEVLRPDGERVPAHLRSPLVVMGNDMNEMYRHIGQAIAGPYLTAVADPEAAITADLKRIGREVREKLGAEVVGRLTR